VFVTYKESLRLFVSNECDDCSDAVGYFFHAVAVVVGADKKNDDLKQGSRTEGDGSVQLSS
jgi:hypothetical protein